MSGLQYQLNDGRTPDMMWRILRTMAVLWVLLQVSESRSQTLAPSTDAGSAVQQQTLDERLLFFPSKYPAGEWRPADLLFSDIWFTADDGTRLHGWYCPAEQPRGVILLAHGNAGNISSRAATLRLLQHRVKLAVLIFDYRGFGRSDGTPTVAGAIQDAQAARTKLCQLARVTDSEIILMGESLGGAIAVQLAASSSPRGLVLQSTFSSLKDVAGVHFPKLSWLVPDGKLNSAATISRYRGPLLQSHGTADRTVPLRSAERLFAAAGNPKQFVHIENAGHNNWMTEDYLNQLDQFVTRLPAPK